MGLASAAPQGVAGGLCIGVEIDYGISDAAVNHRGSLAVLKSIPSIKMWPTWRVAFLISSIAIIVAALYVAYRLIDPLPPHHVVIAASTVGPGTITLRSDTASYSLAMV